MLQNQRSNFQASWGSAWNGHILCECISGVADKFLLTPFLFHTYRQTDQPKRIAHSCLLKTKSQHRAGPQSACSLENNDKPFKEATEGYLLDFRLQCLAFPVHVVLKITHTKPEHCYSFLNQRLIAEVKVATRSLAGHNQLPSLSHMVKLALPLF